LLFCYVLANCLERSESCFSYSQQPKFCYVSSNADNRQLAVLFLVPVYPKFVILLCISKLPGVERLTLFLYSQQPKFCYVSSNADYRRLNMLFLITVLGDSLYIIQRRLVVLFLLTGAKICYVSSNAGGVEYPKFVFINNMVVPGTDCTPVYCIISSKSNKNIIYNKTCFFFNIFQSHNLHFPIKRNQTM
jgi:hypothetical protein